MNRFLHRRWSCPECGMVYREEEVLDKTFRCRRCDYECTREDFVEDNIEKWSREADLSQEEAE